MSSAATLAIDADESLFDMRRREPEQQSLFSTQDLIVPESLARMKKAVCAIHATPVKAEHNQGLNSRRLFDACIMVAQIHCRGRERELIERIRKDRISPMFEVRITELVRLAGIPGKNYERIYEELDKLYELSLNWNVVNEDNEVEWNMKAHFMSTLGHGKGLKRGLVRFAFDPSILEIVLEPSRWAMLSLQVMEDLKTAPSYALYQNAWRYIGTQNKVTAALPVTTWAELLIGKSRFVIEDDRGEKTMDNYGDFKRRVLLDAMRRVNAVTALTHTLELKEIKSGKRVTKLQFKFVPKDQPSLGIPLTWPDDLVKSLQSLGLTQNEIETLSEAHSYEVIAEALVILKAQEAKMRATNRIMGFPAKYFLGILANISGGAKADEIDSEKIAAEVQAEEARRAAEAREVRLKREFEEHQRSKFREWFFAQPEDARSQWANRFVAEATVAPTLKAAFKRPLDHSNESALASLRLWITKIHPELIERIYPSPEDLSFEAWLTWRVDNSTDAGGRG